MKLSEHIFARKMYFYFVTPQGARPISVYAALLKGIDGGQNILIDCGVSYNLPDIEQLCAEAGIDVSAVDTILNTHCHADHCGGNSTLKEKIPHLKFMSHPKCAWMLADKERQASIRPVPYFHFLMKGNTTVDKILEHGEILKDTGFAVNVIYTPGHSGDSISFYVPDDRILICGDAVINMHEMPFYEDAPAMYASLTKLSELKPEIVLSAFDGPWNMNKDGDLFVMAKERLDLIQETVNSILSKTPNADPEDVGKAVLQALKIDMPPSPLFLAGIKSHMDIAFDNSAVPNK